MGKADSIPVISQIKSLVQLIGGDQEGAKKTQENFIETAPVVSQITSLVYALDGNMDKARETQETFAKSMDELTDSWPIIGHAKAIGYYAAGNKEKGDDTMKSATGSAVSIAGGIAGAAVGGPVGAAVGANLGSNLYDGIVTGIETAIHGSRDDGSPRYYGSWNSYDRMAEGKASLGEAFDTVGMPLIDAAFKFGKGRKTYSRASKIRYTRDVEYNLTTEEVEFATNHQQLPGNVSEVLSANWQQLSVPETVSNLVSLFVILRLILWNDKNGRAYSRELCSFATDTDYTERCQDDLMKTLRRMDDQLASKIEDSNYVLNPVPGKANDTTAVMIRVMATLYGILDSMGRGQKMGIKWMMELCIYEDLRSHSFCEREAINKLKTLSQHAFFLGKARKRRIKRQANLCRRNLQNLIIYWNNIRSKNVGTHRAMQRRNQVRSQEENKRFQSNHIPPVSAYNGKYGSNNLLPAHSIPELLHQVAMMYVGTSKNTAAAKFLRRCEAELIEKGNMADAIKLDFTASYGRANVNFNKENSRPRPALVEYADELHAVVNEHKKNITPAQANKLHEYIDDQVQYWNANQHNWDDWFDRMQQLYSDILNANNITLQDGIEYRKKNVTSVEYGKP